MGINTTGNMSSAFAKDLDKLSNDEYMGVRKVGLSYMDIKNMSMHSYKEAEIAGLRGFSKRDEGDALTYDSLKEGLEKEIFFSEYALGVQHSHILQEDDKQGVIKSMAGHLGNAGAYTVEFLAADLLNTAFVTTYRTGIDGVALSSASHPYIDYTGVQSNTATTALSYAGLQAAITHFKSLKDKRGLVMATMRPTLLVIPQALEWMAKELLINEYKPLLELGTATSGNSENVNQKNLLQMDGNIKYVVNPYLTAAGAWFLMDESQKVLKWYWRRNYTFESNYSDFETDDHKMKASFRAAADFINWRGFYASVV